MFVLRVWKLAAVLQLRGASTRKATVETGTTELARLPGLEVPEVPVPQHSGERGRWIERGPSGKLMLFSGRPNPELSERIAELLNISLGAVELATFAKGGGEWRR